MNNCKRLFASLSLLVLTACGTAPITNTDGMTVQDVQTKLLGDMPMPGGTTMNPEKSLILGSGDGWAGRVVLNSPHNATDTFAYFIDQYPKAGWTLVSSTKAKNSILVFIKRDRTATIEIESSSLGGKAQIMLTVAPRSTVVPPVSGK